MKRTLLLLTILTLSMGTVTFADEVATDTAGITTDTAQIEQQTTNNYSHKRGNKFINQNGTNYQYNKQIQTSNDNNSFSNRRFSNNDKYNRGGEKGKLGKGNSPDRFGRGFSPDRFSNRGFGGPDRFGRNNGFGPDRFSRGMNHFDRMGGPRFGHNDFRRGPQNFGRNNFGGGRHVGMGGGMPRRMR